MRRTLCVPRSLGGIAPNSSLQRKQDETDRVLLEYFKVQRLIASSLARIGILAGNLDQAYLELDAAIAMLDSTPLEAANQTNRKAKVLKSILDTLEAYGVKQAKLGSKVLEGADYAVIAGRIGDAITEKDAEAFVKTIQSEVEKRMLNIGKKILAERIVGSAAGAKMVLAPMKIYDAVGAINAATKIREQVLDGYRQAVGEIDTEMQGEVQLLIIYRERRDNIEDQIRRINR